MDEGRISLAASIICLNMEMDLIAAAKRRRPATSI